MGPRPEQTEPVPTRPDPTEVDNEGLGKPIRCRLGFHKFAKAGEAADGDCMREGCDYNWITAMHEDTFGAWCASPSEPDGMHMIPVIGSGEHEARDALMAALGPDWSLTFAVAKDGDRMTIRGPRGAFVIEGERLRHYWIR